MYDEKLVKEYARKGENFWKNYLDVDQNGFVAICIFLGGFVGFFVGDKSSGAAILASIFVGVIVIVGD